jgi:diadenosine tetraphosphate (Ap4A) HIT family hydrolase
MPLRSTPEEAERSTREGKMEVSQTAQQRELLMRRINELRRQGICYACNDLETGELFRDQHVVYEDSELRVALELFPRMPGHTIVLFKPHREDLSELAKEEAARVFAFCVLLMRAMKEGLGAEKVYLNTMCDGGINHFHLQLFPRYSRDPIGSERFVAPRGTVIDGAETARRIRDVLLRLKGDPGSGGGATS